MHNGGLGAWKHIKRRLGQRLADEWYLGVKGGTDSEWAFALFLDTLERMGHDPSNPPENGFGPNILRQAMLKVIKQINLFIKEIPEKTVEEENIDTRSLLNFALTDGHSVICTRYVSSKTDEAASLYYSSGTTWDDKKKGNFQMDRRDKGADIVLVASEPLTFERGMPGPLLGFSHTAKLTSADNWVTVPTNSILTIHKQTVMVHPIIDEYYNQNPAHHRSSQFVCQKGLIADKTFPLNPVPASSPVSVTPSKHSEAPDKHMTLPSSRLDECHSSSGSSRSAERFNENSNSYRPISSITSIPSSRDPSKPQEQGNTKKKRVSIEPQVLGEPDLEFMNGSMTGNPLTPNHNRFSRASVLTNGTTGSIVSGMGALSPTRETGYGSPAKINQYFPELS